MELIQSIRELRTKLAPLRGQSIGLVPTMGALHQGHLALVQKAKSICNHVVVSIFVNPTQFGQGEDFDVYPRNLDRDLKALASIGGVDFVFHPKASEVYPFDKTLTWVEVKEWSAILCGQSRPTHFRGVTTVVTMLFHMVQPTHAFFGMKDYQQWILIQRMTRELHFDIQIIGVPTVREEDGLALSSRNAYLSPQARVQATTLYQTLLQIKQRVLDGERSVQKLLEEAREKIRAQPLLRIDYIQFVDLQNWTLLKLNQNIQNPVLLALAVFAENTRLIDNIEISPP